MHRDRPSDDGRAVSPPRRFAVARRRAPATSKRSCGQPARPSHSSLPVPFSGRSWPLPVMGPDPNPDGRERGVRRSDGGDGQHDDPGHPFRRVGHAALAAVASPTGPSSSSPSPARKACCARPPGAVGDAVLFAPPIACRRPRSGGPGRPGACRTGCPARPLILEPCPRNTAAGDRAGGAVAPARTICSSSCRATISSPTRPPSATRSRRPLPLRGRGLAGHVRYRGRPPRDRLRLYQARRAARRGRLPRRRASSRSPTGRPPDIADRGRLRLECRHLPVPGGHLPARSGGICAGRPGRRARRAGRAGREGSRLSARCRRLRARAVAVDRLCGDGESRAGSRSCRPRSAGPTSAAGTRSTRSATATRRGNSLVGDVRRGRTAGTA